MCCVLKTRVLTRVFTLVATEMQSQHDGQVGAAHALWPGAAMACTCIGGSHQHKASRGHHTKTSPSPYSSFPCRAVLCAALCAVITQQVVVNNIWNEDGRSHGQLCTRVEYNSQPNAVPLENLTPPDRPASSSMQCHPESEQGITSSQAEGQ